MSEPAAEKEKDLDAYLRRRYSEAGWEEDDLQQALRSDLATKRSL